MRLHKYIHVYIPSPLTSFKANVKLFSISSLQCKCKNTYCLTDFVCLEFFVPLENFPLIWRRHHYRRRATNFDSWPLSREWSYYCDTGQLYIMSISKDPWHYDATCCQAFCSGAGPTWFNDLGLSRPGIEPRSPACDANAVSLRHRGGLVNWRWLIGSITSN